MREYTYAEIKQSRILSEKKSPKFGIILMILMIVFLVGLLAVSAFLTKPYVVTFEGEITGNEVELITNKVSGTITRVNVKSGDVVEVGDLLYTIDPTNVEAQIEELNVTKKLLDLKIDSTLLLIKYINNYELSLPNTMVNPFEEADLNQAKEYNFASEFNTFVQFENLNQTQIDAIKPSFVVNHYETYDEYLLLKTQTQSTIDLLTQNLNDYEVRALNHGVVYLNEEIKVGTNVIVGTTLGTLENANPADFYIEALVEASSKVKIAVDDEVEISVKGLNSKEFGTLKGDITEIKDETVVYNGVVYYYVVVKPQTTTLKDNEGNIVPITCNMSVDCVVQYDETTWLQWALSKLGVDFK